MGHLPEAWDSGESTPSPGSGEQSGAVSAIEKYSNRGRSHESTAEKKRNRGILEGGREKLYGPRLREDL